MGQIIFGYPRFRFLACQIYVNENGQAFAAFLNTDTLKPLCQFERIKRMYDIKKLNGLSYLVRLQMPDQMPFNLAPADLFDLNLGFLNLVLTKSVNARTYRLQDSRRRMRFGDCNQFDLVRPAVRSAGRVVDPLLYRCQIFDQ